MRAISFAFTAPQFLDGSKTVTRRLGWSMLGPGDQLKACRKCMGLKKGEQRETLGTIEIISVRREPLRAMTDDLDYGFSETEKEGFPAGTPENFPSAFVDFFCRSHKGCLPETTVTRIEFRKRSVNP